MSPTGRATIVTGAPDVDVDGDGSVDGIGLDFDGDGRIDDVMADLDGDGIAERAVLDSDDDGQAESYFSDDGSGTWAVRVRPVRPGALVRFGRDRTGSRGADWSISTPTAPRTTGLVDVRRRRSGRTGCWVPAAWRTSTPTETAAGT